MEDQYKAFLTNPPERIKTAEVSPPAFKAMNLNKLSNDHILKNVGTKEERDELIDQGWKNIKKNPKSYQMGQLKKHDEGFEEKVWSLFARMGYPIMNELKTFGLQYDQSLPPKQIDVFAADEETTLIIECKSSARRRKRDLKKDIGEYASIKNDLRKAAQKLIPGKQKVAFIFFTNNIILSENDEKRLEKAEIFHFNQDAIRYYEQLTQHLGSGAKYQFMGMLFEGQKIEELKTRVPAIEGKLGKNRYYTFAIQPKVLLKIGYVMHRTDPTTAAVSSYQRLVNKSRLREISAFIEDGGFFPNSLILNISTKRKPQFDLASYGNHDSSTKLGILHLPKLYRSAWVIDGQHRLFGYAHTEVSDKRTVPVVAFVNLDNEQQSQMFVDINSKQKGVSRNLLTSIMSEFGWGSKDIKIAMDALKTRIITDLDGLERSPLYKRIILSEEAEDALKCITLTSVKSYGLNQTKFFGKIERIHGENTLTETGTLWDGNIEKTLKKSVSFLTGIFDYVSSELEQMWNIGRGLGGFISMNAGVSLIIRLSDSIINHLRQNKGLNPHKTTPGDLAAEVVPYLEPAVNYLNDRNAEEIIQLRQNYLGAQAVKNLLPIFQDSINKEFSDYKPEGLEKWQRDSTGEFKDKSYTLGHKLEKDIFLCIINKLKVEFGQREWWYKGVPDNVRKSTALKKEQDQSHDPPETFFELIDARKIVMDNWTLLGNTFTPPGLGNVSKEKKTEWIVDWNSLRKRYSHPQKPGIITEEEYLTLEKISIWLYEQIKE